MLSLFTGISVFAKRVGTSRPVWDLGAWKWDRFAAALTPRPPQDSLPEGRLKIPWPNRPKSTVVPPGLLSFKSDSVN